MTKTTALAAGAVLVLAACGGGDDDTATESTGDQLVISDSGAAGDGGDLVIADGGSAEASTDVAAVEDDVVADASSASTESSEDEQALAFAACMRDEGIDWPDPTFNADGSIDLLGGLGPGGGGGDGAGQLFSDQDSLEDAFEVCGPLIEGASFLPDQSELLNEETQDQLLEFAQCLRDQGLDVDDPDLSVFDEPGAAAGGGLFGEGFDPNDPAVQDAIGECQGLFVGGPLGGGGN